MPEDHSLLAPCPLGWGSWDDLRYFLAAAREGSLNAAGRRLGVDHTTVGRRLRAMEARLGVRLFDRRGAGLEPTPAAREALEDAARLEAMVAGLLDRLRGADGRVEGEVRVNASEGFATFWLLPRLKPFLDAHPQLRLSVVATQAEAAELGRDVDMALMWSAPTSPGTVARRLCTVGYSVYALPDYAAQHGLPATEADFARHRILHFRGYEVNRGLKPWCDLVARHGAAMVLENAALTEAALRNGYVTLLPDYAAVVEPALVRAPVELGIRLEVWLSLDGARRHSGRVRALADEVVRLVELDRGVWFD